MRNKANASDYYRSKIGPGFDVAISLVGGYRDKAA